MFTRTHQIGEYRYHEVLESYRSPKTGLPTNRCLARWPVHLSLAEAIAIAERQKSRRSLAKAKTMRAVQARWHEADKLLLDQPAAPVEPAPLPAKVNHSLLFGDPPPAPPAAHSETIATGYNPTPAPALGRFLTPFAQQQDFDRFTSTARDRDRATTVLLAAGQGHGSDREIAQALGREWGEVMRILLFLRDQGLVELGESGRVHVAADAIDEFNHRLDRNGRQRH